MIGAAPAREQTRARYPDEEGFVERGGVRIFWERYGEGEPAILLLPTWSIIHSRCWKMQVPYLARAPKRLLGRTHVFDRLAYHRHESDRDGDCACCRRDQHALGGADATEPGDSD